MSAMATMFKRISLATAVSIAALFCSDDIAADRSSSVVSAAQARVGRPLTPMSYAGVARRTTRRTVAVGAAATAGAVAVGAAATRCRQVVDAYGRVVTVCP